MKLNERSPSVTEQSLQLAIEHRLDKGHACFRNFRTITGYGRARYIDLVAVGMWDQNWGIKCFEIKVRRQDFISDVAQFEKKHLHALEISQEFYYVCPWGLIEREELPEKAGLYWLNSAGALTKKRQAPKREMKEIAIVHFMAFAREFGHKIDHTKIPIKYLGREISQDEFLELVKKEADKIHEYRIERKAAELVEESLKKDKELRKTIDEIHMIVGHHRTAGLIDAIREHVAKSKTMDALCDSLMLAEQSIKKANTLLKGEKE